MLPMRMRLTLLQIALGVSALAWGLLYTATRMSYRSDCIVQSPNSTDVTRRLSPQSGCLCYGKHYSVQEPYSQCYCKDVCLWDGAIWPLANSSEDIWIGRIPRCNDPKACMSVLKRKEKLPSDIPTKWANVLGVVMEPFMGGLHFGHLFIEGLVPTAIMLRRFQIPPSRPFVVLVENSKPPLWKILTEWVEPPFADREAAFCFQELLVGPGKTGLFFGDEPTDFRKGDFEALRDYVFPRLGLAAGTADAKGSILLEIPSNTRQIENLLDVIAVIKSVTSNPIVLVNFATMSTRQQVEIVTKAQIFLFTGGSGANHVAWLQDRAAWIEFWHPYRVMDTELRCRHATRIFCSHVQPNYPGSCNATNFNQCKGTCKNELLAWCPYRVNLLALKESLIWAVNTVRNNL